MPSHPDPCMLPPAAPACPPCLPSGEAGSMFGAERARLCALGRTTASVTGNAKPDTAAPLRILVVDDNVDAAVMLSMLLEAAGHEVLVEHHARGALARLAAPTDAPDVFLLDIGLPEMDGNALARYVRAHPAGAGAVLIAITGYGQARDRAQTAAAGFDHHFVKPVDLEKLYAILATVRQP